MRLDVGRGPLHHVRGCASDEKQRSDRHLGNPPADELRERILLDPLPERVISVNSVDQLTDTIAILLSGRRKSGETLVTERCEGIVLESGGEGPVFPVAL